ncbi:hypothetical protein TCAL_06918 [Tigriopus californicus]|uniref:Uncharacterized protein n=1 Tax=Tigriopus californicus TaxID=6832 RepID=A0A553NT25_TIGCA|nr:micronuclear linker histone polyprotein-like [Tigriopus californicus]TRY68569.1 hypothetical protein TCAL_06918 [Tigriopus californicus]|eukprot:TCALIF_06918-PA protein Name:"Protein of unknown function" AED:0.12 eAED:0.12 QI:110/1/0.5/1/1/1/2/0/838
MNESSSPDWDSQRRFQKVKQRLKGRFHVKTKRRKTVSVKCSDLRAKNNLSLSRSRLATGSHGACPSPTAHHLVRHLRSQNVALASSLNERLMENTELSNMVHALRDENMALNMEIAELRHAQNEPTQTVDPVWLEQEQVKRLAEYMEPVKGLMNRVLDHTVSMSEELSQAMALVSAPGRRSRSMHAQRATQSSFSTSQGPFNASRVPSLPSEAISSSRSSSNGANIAHVSPRVAGYAIHKPQIEIQRLDMNEINRLQAEQREQSRRSRSEDASEEVDDEHEEEPLEPAHHTPDTPPSDEGERVNRRPSRSRIAISRMSTIGEGSDEEEQPTDRTTPESRRSSASNGTPRRVPRRRSVSIARQLSSSFRTSGSPVVLLENVSELLEQYNVQNLPASDDSGSEDENENEEYLNETDNSGEDDELCQDTKKKSHGSDSSRKDEVVLLMPTCRLVLERVKLSERRRSSKSSENASRLSACSSGSIKKRSSDVAPNILSGITTQRGKKASSESWRNSTRTCEADSSSNMIDVPADAESTRLDPRSPVVSTVRNSLQSEQSETPLTSESLEEFTARMCNMDPMEGPSWLFTDDDEVTPGRRSREVVARKKRSSVSLRAQIGDCSKKLDLDHDEENAEVDNTPVSKKPEQNGATSVQPSKSRKRTVHWKPSLDGATLEHDASNQELQDQFIAPSPPVAHKSPESVPKRKSIRQSRVKKPKPNHDEQPITISDPSIPANTNKTSPKAKIPTRSPSRASSSSSHSIPSTPNAPSENGSIYSTPCAAGDEETGEVSRPRRRAATAASNSLKEPSLNKKMRQGDPHSESVYSNFVPKVKEKVAKTKSKK